MAERLKAEGITVDACGVVAMKNDEAQVRQVFEYAKALGVLSISAGPDYDALPLVDAISAEYGIPVAIHNHGPEDKLYAKPEMFREHLAKVSNRVGLCVDLGHFNRSGVDPMAVLDEFAGRINGIHLKDMVQTADGKWEDAIVGKGKVDMVAVMRKLKAMNYQGPFSLEYESDPDNPLPKMQECLVSIREAAAQV